MDNEQDFSGDQFGNGQPQDDFVGNTPKPPDAQPPLGSAIGSQFGHSDPAPPVVTPPTPQAPTPPSGPPPTGMSAPAPGSDAVFGGSAEYPVVGPADDSGGSSKLPWVVALVAVFVLLGGAGFFAISALGASGGEASPEEAIEVMLAAMEVEDFVTVAELLEPSERRTLAEPALTELLPELIRLGVFDESADAGNVEGVDLAFNDVEYEVERLVGVDDIAHVRFTNGELATIIDSESLPLGGDIDTADLSVEESNPVADGDTPLVFVERDDRWYFSMWFSLAENARLQEGERLPGIDESPAQVPSDSPEAAIEGMFTAMTNFDMAEVIGHMDPDEMAALYRYSPLFIEEIQAELDEARGDLRDEGIFWEFTDWDFDVAQDGDDAVVEIRGFTFDLVADALEVEVSYGRDELIGSLEAEDAFDSLQGRLEATTTNISFSGELNGFSIDGNLIVDPDQATITGEYTADGDSFEGSLVLDPDGVCSEFRINGSDGTNETLCLEDEGDIDSLGPIINAMEEWPDEFPGIAMRTRQTDGGWYVSPIGTMFDGVLTGLEGLEEGDLETVFNPVSSAAEDAALDPFGILDDLTGDDTEVFSSPPQDDPEDVIIDADPDADDSALLGDPTLGVVTDISVAAGTVEQFNGAIEVNSFDAFVIDLEAGEPIVITAQAESGSLDTVLAVFGPDGSLEASNDDASPALSSGVRDSQVLFTPTTSGSYSFEISGFDATDFGSYILTVDRFGFPDPANLSPASQQTFNEAVGGSGEFTVPIELVPGDDVVITVESETEGFDPVVELWFEGQFVGQNDDAADSAAVRDRLDSQLIETAFATGEHEVTVIGYGNGTGDFTMTIEIN